MTLRRTIITAAMVAGCLFTLMLGWMAYTTYPVPMPNLPTIAAFMGVVLLFWWLIGSMVAHIMQQEVARTVAAIRGKLETGISLRRRLEQQRSLIGQFASDSIPMVHGLAQQAQLVAQQAQQLVQHASADLALEQLAILADECSRNLLALSDHAHQAHAQSQLLHHELTALSAHETPMSAQLLQLHQLAQQCNLLALNAAIETTRSMDRRHGVGLLSYEIQQLGTAGEHLATAVQQQAHAMQAQTTQSLRSAQPLAQQMHALIEQADNARAVHDEQCEQIDGMRGQAQQGRQGNSPKNLRQQMLTHIDAITASSGGLRQALESTLKNLQMAT